jgi:teichuronic acid biosynthesis glycosyltransferase TuaC
MRLPLSIKARGTGIAVWGGQDFARRQMIAAASEAKGLLAASRDLAGQMAAMGIEPAKITVHYTGLDRDRFRPFDHTQLRRQLSEELGFAMPANAPLLACVGALIARKGQGIALRSLREVLGARLVLAGKGEDEARLRALAASEGVADRVFFAGSIDHDLMPLILSAADVSVLPTASEGLANAWVESLACGTPVVTSDVGAARELIASPTAGRLVARNAAAVAAGINAVLNDPPPREAVSGIVEHFSWEANAAALAEHYERMVSAA